MKAGTAGGSLVSSATSACLTYLVQPRSRAAGRDLGLPAGIPAAVLPSLRLRPTRRGNKRRGRRDEASSFTQRVVPVVLENASRLTPPASHAPSHGWIAATPARDGSGDTRCRCLPGVAQVGQQRTLRVTFLTESWRTSRWAQTPPCCRAGS